MDRADSSIPADGCPSPKISETSSLIDFFGSTSVRAQRTPHTTTSEPGLSHYGQW